MQLLLPNSLGNWDTPAFAARFCEEVAMLPHGALPLHRALAMGSHVVDHPPQVMLLASQLDDSHLSVKAGVFFKTVLGGCNCADDPTPLDQNNEYCELWFRIDRRSGAAEVTLA